jgi:hypothetical protein
LVSPTYFGHNVIWHIPPDQEVYTNASTGASFKRNAAERDFTTALIYRLQRKSCNCNDQSNANSALTKGISTNIQLVVIWRVYNSYKFHVNVMVIEHGDVITWDEDKLKRLYSMHRALHTYGPIIEDTWLLDDETVIMISSRLKVGRTIEITISEGASKDSLIRPIWISSDA